MNTQLLFTSHRSVMSNCIG